MDKDNLQVYMRIFNVLEFTKIMFGMNALPFKFSIWKGTIQRKILPSIHRLKKQF